MSQTAAAAGSARIIARLSIYNRRPRLRPLAREYGTTGWPLGGRQRLPLIRACSGVTSAAASTRCGAARSMLVR